MASTILLSVDCFRADHVGCYGYDHPTTPNIDSFAADATRYPVHRRRRVVRRVQATDDRSTAVEENLSDLGYLE